MRAFNSKILVIDDDETIRDSFREILCPSKRHDDSIIRLKEAESALFDDDVQAAPVHHKRSSATFEFIFHEAPNGKKGFEMVQKAMSENSPYAAIFVDMRMPGWDGLETVQHLRSIDKRAEIIFVTAYSDHSIDEIVNAVGNNVSYHCKPFASEEIEQIATKAVYEWNKTSNLEELINNIASLRAQRWQIKPLLSNILQQVSDLLGAESALIAVKVDARFEKLFAIGTLLNDDIAENYLSTLPQDAFENCEYYYQNSEIVYFNIEKFGILAIFETSGGFNNERIYIVRLFLEQAAMAIKNVDLQEALIRKEKLSAVGQATSMIAHDLKNIFGGVELGLEILENELEGNASAIDTLNAVKTASKDCTDLVNDILDFAGNKEVKKNPADMRDIVGNVKMKMEMAYGKAAIPLSVHCEGELLFSGDERKIFRAIFNLVKNANEVLADKHVQDPHIRISAFRDGGNMIVEVADNGPGIPAEIQDTLFMPFVTVGKSGGTGLGLAIVKQFVEAHKGNIYFTSSERGTVFKISIPAE